MSEVGYATWSATPELQRPDFEPRTPGGCVDLGYRQIHGMTCKDAKLIAAAPDMLAALVQVRNDINAYLDWAKSQGRTNSEMQRIGKGLDAAIAKAKGKA